MRARLLRGAVAATIVIWGLLAVPAGAAAHAIILESEPARDAKLAEPPARIYLRFNSKIEKRLTRVSITASDGRAVALPVVADGRQAPDRLSLSLGPLRPGAYIVRYKVLAVDGHITEGALRFSVLEAK
jgi:methionine-rich copper-binding protein CopC